MIRLNRSDRLRDRGVLLDGVLFWRSRSMRTLRWRNVDRINAYFLQLRRKEGQC